MSPERLHLVLNHVPLIGFALALLPLLAGLARRSRELVAVGLVTGLLCGLAAPAVFYSGEEAEERLEERAAPVGLDQAGERWLDVHEERAEAGIVFVYLAACACLGGLVVLWRKPEWQKFAGAGAAGLLGVAVLMQVWVADAGGKIRHPELRPEGTATPAATERASHDDDDHDDDD